MADTCKDEDGADNRHGDVPSDNLLPQHVGQTQEQGQRTDLTHSPGSVGMVAKEEVER